MKSRNLRESIARRYTAGFARALMKASRERKIALALKEIADSFRKLERYDDLSYLASVFSPENRKEIARFIDGERQAFAGDMKAVLKSLDDLYADYFEGHEILDVKGIRKELSAFGKDLRKRVFPFYLGDLVPIAGFPDALMSELGAYVAKHRLGEYVEMDALRNNVRKVIDGAKSAVETMDANMALSAGEYVDGLFDQLKTMYSSLFEGRKNKGRALPEWAKGLLFMSPWLLGFLLFTFYPIVETFVFSFSSVNVSTAGFVVEGIGMTNYINVLTTDSDFLKAIGDYIVKIVIYVPLITVFSLLLALLLNSKVKGTGFFRTIFFLPVIITSGPVIKILIDQGVTAIPGLAELIHFEEITKDLPHFAVTALSVLTDEFVMILWFSGIQILVFMTALQKIDRGIYEAASIDGASGWERFWKVTIPALNPTIVINVVFTIVMQSLFALNPIILKIQADMNDTSRGYGYASAIAFLYFAVMIVLLGIFVLIFKHHERKGGRRRRA